MNKKQIESNQNQFTVSELGTITEAVRQSNDYTNKKVDDRYRDISWVMIGVVVVTFIAFVQMLFNLFQINNASYKDYTQRLEERNEILSGYKQELQNNRELLEKIASQSGVKK